MSAEALQWFKSTYSGSEGGQCLEVAVTSGVIHVRDSKQHPEDSPTLKLAQATWVKFAEFAAG
ncbi:DUF397 domain-containing protein [Streptomyces collinus]|uniref:DUF397 domain-containing protein n=1 Tax=Streptomyces collinus (strain DSM 40733 / Tue 365) TaxID=1214242 RepID=S5VKB6_STRC3|nr:DUF397 domain-containing protein [Streptomyces collinus]AGS71027.1 hypothetical protein B446_21075 [Streptomyces collinus Tu 365]UJA09678.1 hypothetical protein HGI10_36340 [Streptomyces collinus]UJA15458.1 hypothetical protein HGI09_27780 [Streptomyces collinus]